MVLGSVFVVWVDDRFSAEAEAEAEAESKGCVGGEGSLRAFSWTSFDMIYTSVYGLTL
jgi:hypothetical protein